MSRSPRIVPARPWLLALSLVLGAAVVGGLYYAGRVRQMTEKPILEPSTYFFVQQDMGVLAAYAVALALMACWVWSQRAMVWRPRGRAPSRAPWILIAIVLVVVAARLGRLLVFHDYSVSRDEVMTQLASAYLSQGHIGWQIPAQWLPYQRAMVPEFYSPYGANQYWTAVYLPVHAAIRALFLRLGDPDLAAPVTLGIGLLVLWQIARKLLPGRSDAQAVVMIMALSSAQLIATAMTPFAMTSHFTFNLIWLALVLRGGKLGHGLAGVVALLAAGLHQWHFPLLFIGPFVLWLALSRRWGAAIFHALVCVAMMLVWAKLWPLLLVHAVGPPPPVDAERTNGVFDKILSLFDRLGGSWRPLEDNARLLAWNNLLAVPLALLSLISVRWRSLFRAPSIVLPLMLGVLIGMGLALYQGYGWGFRYMHGQIGSLCLLAGFGWATVVPQGDTKRFRLVNAATLISLLAGIWLLATTEHYARGYARTMAAIRASKADVVLVDSRGGFFIYDLVRLDHGWPNRGPAVMAMNMLSIEQLDQLCAKHSVAIMDYSQFWALGVHRVPLRFQRDAYMREERDHLTAIGCGQPVIAPANAKPPRH